MNIRIASLCSLFVFAASIPAQAQKNLGDLIKNLNAEVAALKDRVDKLEGNITDIDLVGTYRFTTLINDLDADDDGAGVQIVAAFGTMELRSDNTGTLDAEGEGIFLQEGMPWTSGLLTPSIEGPTEITWSYDNGSLHISDGTPNLDISLNVGVGGRVLTWSGLSDDNTIDLGIAIRLE